MRLWNFRGAEARDAFGPTLFGNHEADFMPTLSPLSLAGNPGQPTQFLAPSGGVGPNGKPIFTYDQAAAQIDRAGLDWSPFSGGPATVTYAFRSTAPATMPSGTAGFTRFNALQIQATEEALKLWGETANITFVRVDPGTGYSNNATILFGNYSTGADAAAAFAFFPGNASANNQAGDVWVNGTLAYNADPFAAGNEYGQQVLLHEIGHAIGLSHPGDYNAGVGDPQYDTDAVYYQDTRMYTVMSYFGSVNSGGALGTFSNGPQLHDIAAIQAIYGANTSTRTGNDVYGFHSTTGHAHFSLTSTTTPAVFSIWDGGGNDTLDLSGYATNSEIDLRPESFSSAGPGTGVDAIGNISIARGVIIENAIGGSGNDTIIGNDVANVLTGNAGNDVLNGGLGADTMIGGIGNDRYIVDNVSDVITETSSGGVDLVQSTVTYQLSGFVENLTLLGSASINAVGNTLNNVLTGNSGANTLNGGVGADTMIGGAGNDVYVVDNAGDVVTEAVSGGADRVLASINYVLGANVENLTLTGTAAINGTGNTLANLITGNDAANIIDGGKGADRMVGGGGNDNYVVDNAGDTITELDGGGTDLVRTSVTYVLSNFVENLGQQGSAAIDATGNALNNVLTGNSGANTLSGLAGNDTLRGGAGHDVLIGGAGHDHFVFSSINAADSDTISDFSAVDDLIYLDNSVMTAVGPDGALAANAFWSSTTGVAHDADDRVIYNSTTGELFYDADGNGAGGAVLLATLTTHPVITESDVLII